MRTTDINSAATTQYLRLLLHAHPLRARDFVDSLRIRGADPDNIAYEVLIPARRMIQRMRTQKLMRQADVSFALTSIRSAVSRLRESKLGYAANI